MSRDLNAPVQPKNEVDRFELSDPEFNTISRSFVFQGMQSRRDVKDSYFIDSKSTITYHGKNLVRYKPKTAGKNRSDVDGFYRDERGNDYFIKKPSHYGEFFAELLAGKFIRRLKELGYVSKEYHDSLIVADVIDLNQEGFALIQPAMKIEELFKIIGTGRSGNTNRNVPLEMIIGVKLYRLPFVEGEKYFGLSMAVMMSLLVGDYSLHSANVVALAKNSDLPRQYGKIDWGAAFRDYVDPQNYEDILMPKEYQGLFNRKLYTKGYISYYRDIPGFFDAVVKKAQIFFERLSLKFYNRLDALFLKIIQDCVADIPIKIKSSLRKKDILYFGFTVEEADLYIKDKKIFFEGIFADKFSKTMSVRLSKLMLLQDSSPVYQRFTNSVSDESADFYESVIDPQPKKETQLPVLSDIFSSSSPSQPCACCDYRSIEARVTNELLSQKVKLNLVSPSGFLKRDRVGCPIEKQLSIAIPQARVSLSIADNGAGGLSNYLQQEMNANKGIRLIAVPLHVGGHHWVSLMLYINRNNHLDSVCLHDGSIASSSSQAPLFISLLFKQLRLAYSHFDGSIEEYVFQEKEVLETNDRVSMALNSMLFRAYFGKDVKMIMHKASHQLDVDPSKDCLPITKQY